MVLLTLVLYVPEFFLARGVSQRVTAINFVADTLLFAGTLFVIAKGILDWEGTSEPEVRHLARDDKRAPRLVQHH